MASATITSGRYGGGSNGPWLSLHWTEVEQDISGNRTKLRLTLKFHWSGNINYIFYSKSGTLQGSSYTYSGSASGTSGSRTLRTRDVWISHNSDGKKSVTLSGNIKNLGLNWSRVRIGTMSVSGTAKLTDIPRKSDLTSASMTSLQASSAGTLTIGRSVKYSGYYHLVSLYDGGTWIWDTGYFKGNPGTSYTISSTYVNKMLNRMSSVTSKTFRVRLRTYSGNNGSGHIGTSEMNMTVNVHSNVMPSSSVPTASISGTGKDNSIGMYVQNISKVDMNASTWTAGYGASVSTRTLIIRHSSGANVDRREYSGPSATSHVMTRSGTYNIYSRVTDTRGRTFTSNARQITFQAYRPPVITEFTATRNADKPTEVSIRRYGNHSGLNGNNSATMTITRRQGNGSWSNVVPPISSTGNFGNTTPSYNNSVTLSYEFRVVYEDSFGSKSEATASVSTQRVVLDIHKNEGVGIGKIHEQGVLDVDGEVYLNGRVMALGGLGFEDTRDTDEQPQQIPERAFSFAFKRASTISNPPERTHSTYAHVLNIAGWNGSEDSGGFPMQMSIGSEGISLRQGTSPTAWGPWSSLVSVSRGSNSNGNWIRFGDGTQIVWGVISHNFYSTMSRYQTLPIAFANSSYAVSLGAGGGGWREIETVSAVGVGVDSASTIRFHRFNSEAHRKSDYGNRNYTFMAMGRWK